MLGKFRYQVITMFLVLGFVCSAMGYELSGNTSCKDYRKSWVETKHSIRVNGKAMSYKALAGYLPVNLSEFPSVDGKTEGCIYFSYYYSGSSRPITFAFNGGPGSSSMWLHMGLVAPNRVDMGVDGLHPNLPFKLIENEGTPLAFSDFVMIDPMATGFSHGEAGSKESPYFNARNDANSVAVFIRNFLDIFARRSSPIFVMGESYGGLRGPLVSKYLAETFSIPVRGLILISPLFSWATISPEVDDDNDLPYFLGLPTMAVVASYHGQSKRYPSSADAHSVLIESKKFAFDRYREALAQGNDLDKTEFHAVAKELSEITGVSQQRIEDLNLRLTTADFRFEVLKNSYKVLGWYDARFTGQRLAGQDSTTAPNPETFFTSAYTAAVNHYLRFDLNFNLPTPYVGANYRASQAWTYDSEAHNFNVLHTLSEVMAEIPNLNLMVASGYYDIVVPSATLHFDLARLNPAIDRHRIEIYHYPGGHMLYTNPVALHQLKRDLGSYYTRALSSSVPIQQH